MKKIFSMFCALMIALSLLGIQVTAQDTTIKVFFTNDVHSRITEQMDDQGQLTQLGYARYATFIKENAKDAAGKLVLDAGDVFHGQPFANLEKGASVAQILKAIGYDAIAIGNHDFNYGENRLETLGIESGAPLLAANITKDGNLRYQASVVKEIGGVKVGIFGLTTPDTAVLVHPSLISGLDFGTKNSIIQTAGEMVEQLRGQGCDIILALTHLGTNASSGLTSIDLAKEVDGIDAIIDGHSHTRFENDYITENNTVIVSAGEYLKAAGMLSIEKQGNTYAISAQVFDAAELSQYAPDTQIEKTIEEINEKQIVTLDKVVGKSPFPLDGERANVRSMETNLTKVVSTAYKNYAGAEISLVNGGDIRASLPEGEITQWDIVNTLPFGNTIVVKSVKGKDIVSALNKGWNYGAGSYLHFDGMVVQYEPYEDENGKHNRVIEAYVNGEPLEEEREYQVAMSDYIAQGGDGYDMLSEAPLAAQFGSAEEALIEYFSQPGIQGKIERVSEEVRMTTEDAAGYAKAMVEARAKEEKNNVGFRVLACVIIAAGLIYGIWNRENGAVNTFFGKKKGQPGYKMFIKPKKPE